MHNDLLKSNGLKIEETGIVEKVFFLNNKNDLRLNNNYKMDLGPGIYAHNFLPVDTSRLHTNDYVIKRINLNRVKDLKLLYFEKINDEYLETVFKCREGKLDLLEYDLVIAPKLTIDEYGVIAFYNIGLIKTRTLFDSLAGYKFRMQFVFKNEKAMGVIEENDLRYDY